MWSILSLAQITRKEITPIEIKKLDDFFNVALKSLPDPLPPMKELSMEMMILNRIEDSRRMAMKDTHPDTPSLIHSGRDVPSAQSKKKFPRGITANMITEPIRIAITAKNINTGIVVGFLLGAFLHNSPIGVSYDT